jgi:hypothetical protein
MVVELLTVSSVVICSTIMNNWNVKFLLKYKSLTHKFMQWRKEVICKNLYNCIGGGLGFKIGIFDFSFLPHCSDRVHFFSFIIHMYIQGLGHFSPLPSPPPLPPTPPLPSPPDPLNTQQKLFCPYF